jgi:hypothetical protein
MARASGRPPTVQDHLADRRIDKAKQDRTEVGIQKILLRNYLQLTRDVSRSNSDRSRSIELKK